MAIIQDSTPRKLLSSKAGFLSIWWKQWLDFKHANRTLPAAKPITKGRFDYFNDADDRGALIPLLCRILSGFSHPHFMSNKERKQPVQDFEPVDNFHETNRHKVVPAD
ncbi:MAG TPA: hypothetical protein VHG89_00670 [Verrucomicrobiae bacterium]|nr:hypothetical protein [Verrucomicrobiae bacterium]